MADQRSPADHTAAPVADASQPEAARRSARVQSEGERAPSVPQETAAAATAGGSAPVPGRGAAVVTPDPALGTARVRPAPPAGPDKGRPDVTDLQTTAGVPPTPIPEAGAPKAAAEPAELPSADATPDGDGARPIGIVPTEPVAALSPEETPARSSDRSPIDRTIGIPRIPCVPGPQVQTPAPQLPAVDLLPAPAVDGAGVIAVPAPPKPDHRAGFAAVGLFLGFLGAAVQLVPHGPARLVLLLVFLMLGPGAAVLSVAKVSDRLVSWALTVTASMTIATGAAVFTLWMHLWWPDVTVAALAGAVIITSAVRLSQLRRDGHRPGTVFPSITIRRPRRRAAMGAQPLWRGRATSVAPLVSLAAALGLWGFALARTDPASVSGYGLTATLGIPFIVAVVLFGIGLAVEVFGRARPAVLTISLLAVPAIMQMTVPLLHGTPEYAWTYKHIGVVDLIREHGHLLASNDIYQQWPGFFATVAILSQVSGVDALAFAAWSSLTFAVLDMLIVSALLRQFTRDHRVIALGVLLSQICMWVDIGYLSPQAYVYTLLLGFYVIVCRWLLTSPKADEAAAKGRIARWRALVLRGLPETPEHSRGTRIGATLAATAVFAAITVSHQLTPFLMLPPVMVLAVLGVLRPRSLAVLLTLVVIAVVGPRLASVTGTYNVFSFDVLANAEGNADNWRTPQQTFSAVIARGLAICVWLAAVVAMLRFRRLIGRVLVPAALGFLPFVTLIAGNYGGEAIYRVFAFSLPFAALLIAGFWAGTERRGAPAVAASGITLAIVLLACLQGLQGQLIVHRVRSADIRAAEYFYGHAESSSSLVLVAPNFPTKLAGNYGSFNRNRTAVDITLVGDPQFVNRLDGSRLPEVETYIRSLGTRTNYLVISDQMTTYTDFFGVMPRGAMASLDSALRRSPDWQVFYQAPGVTIFRLVPAF